MNKNMNAAPAFPDIKDTTPDGWANLASGLTVPESVAPAFPSINETTSHGWSELGSGLIVPESAAKGGAENGMMTRDERITDGQEKFNALKTRAQEGLSKMMQGLKDRFYIGISRGAELPGQIATGAEMVRETIAQKSTEAREVVGQKSSDAKEAILQKGVETKEAISNAWGAARGKAAELFEKGNDVILQNVKVARERKAARIKNRQERRAARQQAREQRVAELDNRQADRVSRQEARQQQREAQTKENMADKLDTGDDKIFIQQEQQADTGATLESMMTERELNDANAKVEQMSKEAERAEQAAEAARLEADANPGDERLQLDAEEKEGLKIAANARLKRATGEVTRLQAAMSQLDKRSETAQNNIEAARERIEERRGRAEARRAARMAARREALGDTWESAKDRIARLANTDPNKIKQFGVKVAKAAGRLTKVTASRLVPMS
jgi:hypothetical protein